MNKTRCVGCGNFVATQDIVGYYPWGGVQEGVCKACYEKYPELKASPALAIVPDKMLIKAADWIDAVKKELGVDSTEDVLPEIRSLKERLKDATTPDI